MAVGATGCGIRGGASWSSPRVFCCLKTACRCRFSASRRGLLKILMTTTNWSSSNPTNVLTNCLCASWHKRMSHCVCPHRRNHHLLHKPRRVSNPCPNLLLGFQVRGTSAGCVPQRWAGSSSGGSADGRLQWPTSSPGSTSASCSLQHTHIAIPLTPAGAGPDVHCQHHAWYARYIVTRVLWVLHSIIAQLVDGIVVPGWHDLHPQPRAADRGNADTRSYRAGIQGGFAPPKPSAIHKIKCAADTSIMVNTHARPTGTCDLDPPTTRTAARSTHSSPSRTSAARTCTAVILASSLAPMLSSGAMARLRGVMQPLRRMRPLRCKRRSLRVLWRLVKSLLRLVLLRATEEVDRTHMYEYPISRLLAMRDNCHTTKWNW